MSDAIPYLPHAVIHFTRHFPDFSAPGYLADERDYKAELSQLARAQLSETKMAESIEQGNFTALLEAAKQIFRHSKNNMPSPQEKTVIGNIDGEQVEPFIRALYDYLYGSKPWTERLAQFAAKFEQITGSKATWPHLTLYPFLLFPEEHIFLKPEAMRRAAEVLGFHWDYQSSPDLNTYFQFQALARQLLSELQSLGARDMIDVQSFLWVVAWAAPNYWRIMPGKEARYWEQFRDLERIAAGWEDIGSLTGFNSKSAIKESLKSATEKGLPYINAIAPQLDNLRNVQKGDIVFYMFSPKVLDRANTLEFNEVNLAAYFNDAAKLGETPPAAEPLRRQFTLDGQFTRFPKEVPDLRSGSILATYRQRLAELNELLAPFTLHFGYRVADEILLYLWHAHNLAAPNFDLDTAFDHQLYQKILPKLHGSEAKLRGPLKALQSFCEKYVCPRSLAKIRRMLDQLDKEGFASFA